jgi:hypothetical protein
MSRRLGLLTVLLILVCLPRFNMWDPGPIRGWTAAARAATAYGHPIDVEGYVRLVRYFRGEAYASDLIAPFCHRPLAPAVASVLPFAPTTAINVVNLASLIAALWILDAICGVAGLGGRGRWAAGLMWVVAFPTFGYGTIGFVDPVAIATSALVLLLVLRRAPLAALVGAVALATLAKETNALVAFVLVGTDLPRRPTVGVMVRAALLLVAGLATFLLVQELMPVPGENLRQPPGLDVAAANLTRPKTYLTFILTLAVPVTCAALAFSSGRARATLTREARATLLFGSILAGGLYLASVFGAYTDGRMAWVAYPFLIPIAASYFDVKN